MDKAWIYITCILCMGAMGADLGSARDAGGSHRASVVEQHPEALDLLSRAQSVLLQADETRSRNPTEAARLYEGALVLYQQLAREFPGWQSGMVKFRKTYCEARIADLSQQDFGEVGWEAGAWAMGPQPPAERSDASVVTNVPAAPPFGGETVETLYASAAAMLARQEAQEAIQVLRRGLRIDPEHMGLRYLTGLAQCQLGRYEDALFVLGPLVREHPSFAYGHLALGTAYFGLHRIDAARLALEQALKLNPELHAVHFNLAQMLSTISPPDMEAARYHYREAMRLGAKPDRALEDRL